MACDANFADVFGGSLMPITFSCLPKDFKSSIRQLFSIKPDRKTARLEYVDVNARETEVELVTTGLASAFPAKITEEGYARIPYVTFQMLAQALKGVLQPSMTVAITEGEVG